jgi:hypothetical protein
MQGKEECSFLKKRTKRLLFLRQHQHTGHGRPNVKLRKDKSLLLLFFRKEDSSFL